MGSKIAFTSCFRYEAFPNQPQWEDIAKEEPDYLFLLGDHIYMDYGIWPFSKEPNYSPKKYSIETFRQIMDEKYCRQWSEPNFRSLFDSLKKKDALHGVWDDHDFAWNNSYGAHTKQGDSKSKHCVPKEIKAISRELFHKWMDCSKNRPEVYYSIEIPEARVIFLDTRYHAQEPGKNNSLLGKKQFEFLEQRLQHDKSLTIICSGLTMTKGQERWNRYPKEYLKFNELLKNTDNSKRVLYLAGDIHKNKFLLPQTGIRPCHEIISSGLAVNYMGFGLRFDDRHNWSMLDLDSERIKVTLVSRNCRSYYYI